MRQESNIQQTTQTFIVVTSYSIIVQCTNTKDIQATDFYIIVNTNWYTVNETLKIDALITCAESFTAPEPA